MFDGAGPAEATVTGTIWQVSPHDASNADSSPSIGRAVGGVAWVVNPFSNCLSAVGATGELFLQGPLVGDGYLNDSEKTEAGFIENPAWLVEAGHKGRVYRTGDLVHYNADGTLAFIGRNDSQRKIRGQRIELGEIESHVRRCLSAPTKERVDVIAEVLPQNGDHGPTLAAFISIVNRPDSSECQMNNVLELWTSSIDEKLGESLPSYMIPSLYVPLATIPLTGTGKTDRRQLREVGLRLQSESLATTHAQMPAAPSTQFEQSILEVWSEVLNMSSKTISVDDIFTRLGGDSISAMQVVSRCRARNISVTVTDVLQAQTIRKLGARSKKSSPPAVSRAPLVEENCLETWPLSPIQRLFFETNPKGPNQFNQSFLLKLTSQVLGSVLARALDVLVARHTMLRARFRKGTNNNWLQFIEPIGQNVFFFHFQEHQITDGNSVQPLCQQRQEMLDIQRGPVFAVDLFNVHGENQAILLTAHHLVIDLVSWRVIWYDLQQLIETGALSQYKSTSFRAWCHRQLEGGKDLSPDDVLPSVPEQTRPDYWGLEPTDNTYGNSQTYMHHLDKESTDILLRSSSKDFRAEAMDVLLATLIRSFKESFPDRTIPAIFIEGHGRADVDGEVLDISETVGWFTTIYPLQMPSTSGHTLLDTVRYVKDSRRQNSEKGRPYLPHRFYSEACIDSSSQHVPAELLFNFSGVYQQLERQVGLFTKENRIGMIGHRIHIQKDAQRFALIEVNAGIEEGELNIEFAISNNMQYQDRLKNWMYAWPRNLKSALLGLAVGNGVPTLSDFPLLSISYTGLDQILKEQFSDRGISLDDVQDIYPCSPLQEGVLLSIEKGTASYTNHMVWKCVTHSSQGKVDVRRLKQAWKETSNRHSILSTVFINHPESGRFLQVVLKNVDPTVSIVDVQHGAPHETLLSLAKKKLPHNTPNHALTICMGNNGDVACRLDISHALIDAVSFDIVRNGLTTAYSGQPLPLAPPFRSLISHLAQSDVAIKGLAHWKCRLMDTPACEFPCSKSPLSSPGVSYHGSIDVPQGRCPDIYEFCKQRQITRAVFIQAAWGLVLSHFTSMARVCFGYLSSGRDTPVDNVEDLVGPLISMLVADIDLARPIDAVLTTIQERSIEDLQYQHCSLAEILHEARPGANRLFNTSVTVRAERNADATGESPLLLHDVSWEDPHEYDLILGAGLAGARTGLSISFRRDAVSEATAQDVASKLEATVEFLLSSPCTVPALSVQYVTNHDMCKIWEWNAVVPEAVDDTSVHDLIAKTTREQPDAQAVCAWDGQLSYEDLDDLSTRLAHCLIDRFGLITASVVPLCFEKSMWMPVAALAVFKVRYKAEHLV